MFENINSGKKLNEPYNIKFIPVFTPFNYFLKIIYRLSQNKRLNSEILHVIKHFF